VLQNPDDAKSWADLSAGSLARLDAKAIETADVAPLIYLNGLLFGHSKRLDIHHTVLDEAQDFSAFQFDLLSGLTQNASFTIVGDLAQGIHGYRGVESWRDMMEGVFGPGNADYHELVTSYRNTIEIMDFAGKVAARFPFAGQKQAKPVLRHGLRPEVLRLPETHPEAAIAQKVQELLDAGMKTVAVVHKLPADCEALYKKLKGKLTAPLSLYRDGDDEYRGGAMVLPAHMVKGLEFDAIVLADVSAESWPDDALHCRLLYVCLTRPLHRLVCFHRSEPSKLLETATF
jgi:DNA helicase-2/ATP-dependent DNA helicase PcrA